MTTINDRLKDLRYEYGKEKIKQADLEKAIGIPDSSISDYEKPGFYVPSNVIIAYCDYFKVSADYLLGRTEVKNLPNVEIHELRLSEKAMEKLKSHNLNPEIISDLIEHPEFDSLILDMDIYSKGFVDEGLQYVNQIMKTAREKLAEFPKESYDKTRDEKTFSDIMVSQDNYFAYSLSERLNRILRDIREKHKKDKDSSDATPETIAQQIKGVTEAIAELKSIPKGDVTKALRNTFMLVMKIPQSSDSISIIDEFVGGLKTDGKTLQNLMRMSSLIEDNPRKRRSAKAKLKSKKE